MGHVHRTAVVPYSATQMYELVNDVESYPQFLHWCRGARVLGRGPDFVEATVDIGLAGIHKSFTTRNTLDPPHSITVALVAGPLRHLSGSWRFESTPEGGCRVSLDLDFAVAVSPLSFVFSTVFEEIARSQMQAFIDRARVVYGT
jgi:ribosome-associated toxin RatA of RatAB toxin-antitoxin module